VDDLIAVFRVRNLKWHLLAMVVTAVVVLTEGDWWFFSITRGNLSNMLGMTAGILGFFVPLLIPLGLYLTGRKEAAAGAFRAVLVASFVAAFYKIFTGRIQPEFLASVATTDISRGFQFGFFRHGIFWGWPSAHACVSFALSTFLALTYRRTVWVVLFAIAYAVFIAIGAAVSFHWLSDVIAGIIFGVLVGVVVAQTKSIH
jgi:membrane-associated phospholipid phosphatase